MAQAAVSGMVGNAVTQGIGVATGLQDKFSWAGVAAAGVGAGVFNFAARSLPAGMGDMARLTIASGAQVIADAASRSLIEGTDFGDNVMAALPNAIGQTIGEAIAGSMTGRDAGTTGAPNSEKIRQTSKQYQDERIGTNLYGIPEGFKDKVLMGPPLDGLPIIDSEELIVTGTRRNIFQRALGVLEFGAGAVYGFARDTVQGVLSLGDYVIRDMGGSALYWINEGIDALVPGDLPNGYEQSWADYTNANRTAWNLGSRAVTDFGGLVDDVRAGFSAATARSNAMDSAFARGASNPTASLVLNAATLPLAITKARAVGALGQAGRASRAEGIAADAARAAEVANATATGGGLGDIAFGLWRHQGTGNGAMLTRFAQHVGAKTYWDFYDPRVFPTEGILERLMYGADRLHVNLDGVVSSPSQLPEVVQMGSRGLDFVPQSGGGNITNWEIWRIHQDPVLLDRTTFYFDGRPVN